MLTVEEALALVLRDVPAPRIETVDLSQALGRILAQRCLSDGDFPPFDRSMMDGYAVRSTDGPGPFEVVEEVPAGRMAAREVVPGGAIKVMTGAPVPAGADAVQQVEKTAREGGRVRLLEPVKAGQNLARRASELKAGEVVLEPGRVVHPDDIGVLAAIGLPRVAVAARPRCVVAATGDELVPVGEKPGAGRIRNSNSAMISAQVRALGGECEDLGIVRDDPSAIRAAVREGLKRDLLILSGGVSAGDWDLVIPALEAEGVKISMHKVGIKPGKPFCFAPGVFGLPGNPVSSFVIFEVFVRPYLGRRMGADLSRSRVRARLESPPIKAIERTQFLPARIRGDAVETLPWKGSADLFAVTRANAFVVVPSGASCEKGSTVECMRLDRP